MYSTDYERIYIRRPGYDGFISIENFSQPGGIHLGRLGLVSGENKIRVISVGMKLQDGIIVNADSDAAEFTIRIDKVVNIQLSPPTDIRIEDGWQLLWTVDITVCRVSGGARPVGSSSGWGMWTYNLTDGFDLNFLSSVRGEVLFLLASFTNFPVTLQNRVLTNIEDSDINYPRTSVTLYVREDGVKILP